MSCHRCVRGHTHQTSVTSDLLTPTSSAQTSPLAPRLLVTVSSRVCRFEEPPPNLNPSIRQGHSTPVVSLSLDCVQQAGSGAPVAALLFLLASTGSTQTCFQFNRNGAFFFSVGSAEQFYEMKRTNGTFYFV